MERGTSEKIRTAIPSYFNENLEGEKRGMTIFFYQGTLSKLLNLIQTKEFSHHNEVFNLCYIHTVLFLLFQLSSSCSNEKSSMQ